MTTTEITKSAKLAADLSPVMTALEAGYRMIQSIYPDAPDVTIVIKRDSRAWGHTTVAQVWGDKSETAAHRYEIMISGENLRRGAVDVAATLLHEAAHARDLNRGILGTDVNGRHNTKFKATAEDMGLTVAEMGWHGWTATTLDEAGQKRWRKLIERIDKGIARAVVASDPILAPGLAPKGGEPVKPGEGGTPTPGKGLTLPPRRTGNRNLLKAVCGCGHSIRLSRTVLELARPTCQECSQPFEAV